MYRSNLTQNKVTARLKKKEENDRLYKSILEKIRISHPNNIDDCVRIVPGKDENIKLKASMIENNIKDNTKDNQVLKFVENNSFIKEMRTNRIVEPAAKVMVPVERKNPNEETESTSTLTNLSKLKNVRKGIEIIRSEQRISNIRPVNYQKTERSLLKVKNPNVTEKSNPATNQKSNFNEKGHILVDKTKNKTYLPIRVPQRPLTFPLKTDSQESVKSVFSSNGINDSKLEATVLKEAAALAPQKIEVCESPNITINNVSINKSNVKKAFWSATESKNLPPSKSDSVQNVNDANDHWRSMFKPRPSECYPCAESISIRKIDEPYPFKIINFAEAKKIRIPESPQIPSTILSQSRSVQQLLSKQRSFSCGLCDKSYYCKQHLNRHKRTVHPIFTLKYSDRSGSGVCNICGVMSTKIKRHRLIHLQPDGSFNNMCPFCQRYFKKGLRGHIRFTCPKRPK